MTTDDLRNKRSLAAEGRSKIGRSKIGRSKIGRSKSGVSGPCVSGPSGHSESIETGNYTEQRKAQQDKAERLKRQFRALYGVKPQHDANSKDDANPQEGAEPHKRRGVSESNIIQLEQVSTAVNARYHSELAMKAAKRMRRTKHKQKTGQEVCHHLKMMLNCEPIAGESAGSYSPAVSDAPPSMEKPQLQMSF